MDSHSLKYQNLAYHGNGRNCCVKIMQLVEAFFLNSIFLEALNEILQCPRDIFKDTSNEGVVFFPRGRGKDLGNMCYSTLFQLVWYVAKTQRKVQVLGTLAALAERYPSLEDKWPATLSSIELKADIIEYAFAKTRYNTGPAAVPSRRTSALEFNKLARDWFNLWQGVLLILHTNEDSSYSDVIRNLTSPRNLAQLIGLASVAEKLEQRNNTVALDWAFDHYSQ